MKLQDQCCTLSQAKRLKELGVNQSSVACYIGDELHLFEKWFYNWAEQKGMDAVAAFTVAELGVMLPPSDISKGEFTNFTKGAKWLSWSIDCSLWDAPGFPKDGEPGPVHHYTEAECRAEFLIILLENNLITPAEVNDRLANS